MYVKVLEGHGAKEIVIIYYTLYLMLLVVMFV